MKNILFFAAFAAAASFLSCSDNDGEEGNFDLITRNVDVYEEILQADVRITKGSRNYELSVEDNSVASAAILERDDYPYGAVRITGKRMGRTVVTVKDISRRKSEKIEVRVLEPGVQFVLRDVSTDITAVNEDLISDALITDLEENLFFDYNEYYVFSREEKGVLLNIRDSAVRGKRAFGHLWENDNAYILITDDVHPDEAQERRFKVSGPEGDRSAYAIYLDFFHISPATRATGPSFLYIHYEEDLTAKYKTEHPDAGVEKVSVIYAGIYTYTAFSE